MYTETMRQPEADASKVNGAAAGVGTADQHEQEQRREPRRPDQSARHSSSVTMGTLALIFRRLGSCPTRLPEHCSSWPLCVRSRCNCAPAMLESLVRRLLDVDHA